MGKNPPSSMFYRTRLGDAAASGMLIVCSCQLCRRSRIYLATDLLEIYHPDSFVRELFGGRCPRYPIADFWRAHERHATNSDAGMLTVRRLAGVRTTPLWRDELYSALPKPSSD